MGSYTYTMRAENKVVDGLTIHKAAYAGKPYFGFDLDAERIVNGPINRKCAIAHSVFAKRGYVPTHFVTQFQIGEPVFQNVYEATDFFDDSMGGERYPQIGVLAKTHTGWYIERKES